MSNLKNFLLSVTSLVIMIPAICVSAELDVTKYIACMPDKFGNWMKVVNPIVTVAPGIFGTTTMIEQHYSTSKNSVNAQIILSPLGGAIVEGFDPRSLGGEYDNDRLFPDGRVASISESSIASRVEKTMLLWQTTIGTPNADELFEFASYSIDRDCIAQVNAEHEEVEED